MADESKRVTEISSSKMFDGFNKRFKHQSSVCGSEMNLSIYFPPAAATKKVPVWLLNVNIQNSYLKHEVVCTW